MSYIYLPLFLSCLILAQSIYSMDEKKSIEKSIKESAKESAKKKSYRGSVSSKDSVKHKKTKSRSKSSDSSTTSPVGSPVKPEKEILTNKVPTINIMTAEKQRQQDFIKEQLTSPKEPQPSSPRTQQPTSPRQTSKQSFLHKINSEGLLPRRTEKSSKKYSATTDEISTKSLNQVNVKLTQSDSTIITSPKSSQTKMSLIEAIHSQDIELIKKIMEDPQCNVNQQNTFGMTPLHFAVIELMNSHNSKIQFERAKNIIFYLLSDPRIDSSKENNKSTTASQLIQGTDNLPEIRQPSFARVTLDLTVWSEAFFMRMNAHINKKPIDQSCIAETTQRIINKIKATQTKQDEQLPENAFLLFYADNTFIGEMIKLRIQQMLPESTEYLIDLLHTETQKLLFHDEINDNIIIETRDRIKNLIQKKSKKSKSYSLPSWATDKFLFTIIKSYLQEEKEKFKKFLDQNTVASPRKEKLFILKPAESKK